MPPLRRLQILLPPQSYFQEWGIATTVRYRIREGKHGNRFVHFAFEDRRFEALLGDERTAEDLRYRIENQCLRHDARAGRTRA